MRQFTRTLVQGLRATPVLNVVLVLAMIPVIALAIAMPAYAQASSARLLANELDDPTLNRPNFAYLFAHSGSLNGPVAWSEIGPLDAWMSADALETLGLPLLHQSRYVQSVGFALRHDEVDLGPGYLAAISDFDDRVGIVAGRRPGPPVPKSDGSLLPEVAVASDFAEAQNLVPGDVVELTSGTLPAVDNVAQRALVVGTWQATDADAPEWAIHPVHLRQWLFTDLDALVATLGPDTAAIRSVGWYGLTDGTGLTTDQVDDVIVSANRVTRRAQSEAPTIRRELDPTDSLRQFRSASNVLTRRLLAVSVPTLAVLGIFVAVVVALRTNRRRSENALLHSRGASKRHVVVRRLPEAVVLTALAALGGWQLAPRLVAWMGEVSTFLGRSATDPISTDIPQAASWAGWISVGLLVMALIVPVVFGPAETVLDHRARQGRSAEAPWWQRSRIDLIIIAAAAIGIVTSSRPALATGDAGTDDPMVVLIPALIAIAVGLVTLRALPVLFAALAKLLERTSSVSALLTARRLARAPGPSFLPMLLLIMTAATGIVTASFARTLDRQLIDTQWHQAGADINMQDAAVLRTPPSVNPLGGVASSPAALRSEDLLALPEVAAVSRIGYWGADINRTLPDAAQVTWVGVDADSFADTAFTRSDYVSGPETFDALFRKLRSTPGGVLVDERLGRERGDTIALRVFVDGEIVPFEATVAGEVARFPTWDKNDGAIVVGDIDQLFSLTGEAWSYRTLARLEPGATLTRDDVRSLGFITDFDQPAAEVAALTSAPGRQGVFAMLTTGFLTAFVLSIAGFWFTSIHSAQQARADIGLVRAFGLPPRQASGMVVLDLFAFAGAGLAVGVLTGLAMSRWLLPRLVGEAQSPPPMVFEVALMEALAIAAVVGLALFVVSILLVGVVRRQRLLSATRLGTNQ